MAEMYDIEIPVKQIKISRASVVKDNIVYYGEDNEYPNTMYNLIMGSQTAKAAADAVKTFIDTDFSIEKMGGIVVGMTKSSKKYTLNMLKADIAKSLSIYNGAYVLVTKNAEGQTKQVRPLDFRDVRFTEFDSTGTSVKGIVYDWSQTIQGKKNSRKSYAEYPLFTTSSLANAKYAQEGEGTSYQIYHIFLNEDLFYPSNAFETVAYDIATEKEIQVNRYNEITQGTPAKLVLRTDFPADDVQKRQLIEQVKNFAGSKGDRVLIIKSTFDEAGVPISNGYSLDTIPDTRDLSKFVEAEKACANNIRKVWNIPAILIDFEQATGITVSAEQMKTAVDYFDRLIEPVRDTVTEALEEIFKNTTITFPTRDFSLTFKTIREQ